MTDFIQLRDIRILAFCGVLDEEQARRQPFEVDVDITADLAKAGQSDNLEHTINYGEILGSIEAAADSGRFELLECLAQSIADIVLAYDRAEAVAVEVRKTRPPVPQDLASTGVRIYRTK